MRLCSLGVKQVFEGGEPRNFMVGPRLSLRFVPYAHEAGCYITVSLAVLGYPQGGVGLRQRTLLCDLRPISVSPGHVLVITRRVVPTYFDCTGAEQAAVMELVAEVKRLLDERLDPKPDGYNVGFNSGAAAGQTVPHVHVHVIPRYSGDMPDPRGGVRHVIPEKGNYLVGPAAGKPDAQARHANGDGRPHSLARATGFQGRVSLTTGPDRPLWPQLADRLPGASEIDLLASFVQTSGLDHVREGLFSAIATGAKIRLLVGDYLGITSPEALRQLVGWMDLAGPAFEARLVELDQLHGSPKSFHPKAWRIADSSGGIVVVGSSNLSRAALETGVEWNLVGETSGDAPIDRELITAFVCAHHSHPCGPC